MLSKETSDDTEIKNHEIKNQAHLPTETDLTEWPFLLGHKVQGQPILPGVFPFAQLFVQCERSHFEAIKFHSAIPLAAARQQAGENPAPAQPIVYEKVGQQPDENQHADPSSLPAKTDSTDNTLLIIREALASSAASSARTVPDAAYDLQQDAQTASALANSKSLKPVATAAELYQRLAREGNDYAGDFRCLGNLRMTENTATADWSTPRSGLSRVEKLTLVLDSASHLAGLLAGLEGAFLLAGIGQLKLANQMHSYLSAESTDSACLVTVARSSNDAQSNSFDAAVFDSNDQLLATLTGLTLNVATTTSVAGSHESSTTKPQHIISIASSFTADPLLPVGLHLQRAADSGIELRLLDYAQVFPALLNPAAPTTGFDPDATSHTVLVRIEDLLQTSGNTTTTVGSTNSNQLADTAAATSPESHFTGLETYQLPDGRTVAHINRYETEYLYREIFVDKTYQRHGIEFNDEGTIIDIGANIGFFSLFANNEARALNIFAVEPSPHVIPIIKANLAAHAPRATLIEAGVSDKNGEAEFTAYRNSSVFSGFHADTDSDSSAIRTVVKNSMHSAGIHDEELIQQAEEEFMRQRMDATRFTCPLITVSEIIRTQSIERVSLLKIDAEKSEEAVLAGIEAEHWPLIEQIIIEVHTQAGSETSPVEHLLRDKGFEIVSDEEKLLSNSGLVTLYASRNPLAVVSANKGSDTAGVQPATALANSELTANVDLLIDAIATHDASSSKPLNVILCPATTRDHSLQREIENQESRLLNQLKDLKHTQCQRWLEWNSHYPVANIEDEISLDLGHIPYTAEWYAATAISLVRDQYTKISAPYKVIVVDCDNTLWSGVVGEDGIDGVVINAAHQCLHQLLLQMKSQGWLLCMASKNDAAVVENLLANRDDIPLVWSDFTSHAVNWNAKADNIATMAQELNLGLDAFIFIDDSALECGLVRQQIPEVLTLQLPENETLWPKFFDHVWAFDKTANTTTAEDSKRSALYADEKERQHFRTTSGSIEEFIAGLQLSVEITEVNEANLPRAAQMTQRTNQFNLTTVRRSENDIRAAMAAGKTAFVAQVKDRFGDYGITGLVIYAIDNQASENILIVDTLLLSCRVLGRGVEHEITRTLAERARTAGVERLRFTFSATERNEPARLFLQSISNQSLPGSNHTVELAVGTAQQLSYQPTPVAVAKDATPAGESQPSGNTEATPPKRPDSLKVEWAANHLQAAAAIRDRVSTGIVKPRPDIDAPYRAPQTEMQQTVAKVWQQVLGVEGIGINDPFFDLGGSSLKGVEMVARLRQELGHPISVVEVFEAPTVATLCNAIAATTAVSEQAGEPDTSSKDRGARRRQQRTRRSSRT